MTTNYSYQGSMDNAAKAYGKRLRISTKQSIEVCKAIKELHINDARDKLQQAVNKESPIEFTRYSEGAGHKSNTSGMGKYPVKTCKEILNVLKSAEANAQHQGLSSDLRVEHAAAHKAQQNTKYGRHAGREEKGTHIEIVVKEAPGATRPTEDDTEDETDETTDEETEATQQTEDTDETEDDADEATSQSQEATSDEEIPREDETGQEHTEETTGADTTETEQQGQDTTNEEIPTTDWTVPEIKDWLDDHDIDYTSNDRKADLLDKVSDDD